MSATSYLLRTAILPWLLKREGRHSALAHWHDLEASQYWSPQQLLDHQWQRLTALLTHAYETVPYYRRLFDERGLTPASFKSFDDLRLIPVLTRDMIRAHTDELFSNRYRKSELQEFGTGGTTRRRMFFYRDQESYNIKLAAAWRFEGFMGRKPGDKICFVWPAHIDIGPKERLRARLKNRFLLRELMFFAGAPSEELLHLYYRQLSSFRPRYLKVFPNALFRFAEFLQANRLQPPPISAIMATGEILQSYHREKFLEVFGAPTFNMYGSREVGNTASECPHRTGLHIAQETSYVEFIADGKPAPDGAEGELFVTDLTNYGSPMIRYAIEDFGCRLPSACACGRTLSLMSPGVGRMLDRYVAPDGTRHSALALSATIAEYGPPLGQIQYTQKSLSHFHLKVTNDPPVTPEIEAHIRSVIHQLVSPGLEITIEAVDRLPREPSGKIRYFICEVDQPGVIPDPQAPQR